MPKRKFAPGKKVTRTAANNPSVKKIGKVQVTKRAPGPSVKKIGKVQITKRAPTNKPKLQARPKRSRSSRPRGGKGLR